MLPTNTPTSAATDYDVIILGGAFSGTAMGILIKRARPATRVLIVEKSESFDRKVGESTSEVSGCFLTRVLGLSHNLHCDHFPKNGLRLWFTTTDNSSADACTEIGPASQSRLPTFQLDRSLLDEHMLEIARAEGCEVMRPASVKSVDLGGIGENTVTLKQNGETRAVTATWVADCSGRATLLARQRGTWRNLPEHPVHSMWVRFRNVLPLDSHAARQQAEFLRTPLLVSRASATNHLMGRGWWSWIIPLSNGDFSAGVTWDERLFTPPTEGPVGQRVKQHLLTNPVGRLMFADAVAAENDARIYKHLPYYSTEVAGDGWVIAGDAAGFMDPLYSQGLDYCSHSVYTAHKILLKSLDGGCVRDDVRQHNITFAESYQRWFLGIYKNKYQYLGDADIVWAAFQLDIAAYFIGPVRLVYGDTDGEFSKMPYNGVVGAMYGKFMACYNRRFEVIARKRLAKGTYGKNNLHVRNLIRIPFEARGSILRHLAAGLRAWFRLELETVFTKPIPELSGPVPVSPSPHAPAISSEATA